MKNETFNRERFCRKYPSLSLIMENFFQIWSSKYIVNLNQAAALKTLLTLSMTAKVHKPDVLRLTNLSPHLQFKEMLLALNDLTLLRFHLLISLRNQRNFCKSESAIFLLCLSESMEIVVKNKM